jgi:dienelactone hydrolase
LLDRWIIRLATAYMPRGSGGDARLAEAELILQRSDYFDASVDAPRDFLLTSETGFRFRSSCPSAWEENNEVFGRLFRAGAAWKRRPCVVLLHGWNGERDYRWKFPWLAKLLNRQGLNAAMIELPYHGRRRPRRADAPHNFISHDLAQTLAAARQALTDTRALLAWLRAQGAPALGVWGVSLGGWLTGLLACHEPRLGFAALLTPVPRMDLAIAQLPFCEPIRRGLEGGTLRLDALNLRSHRPVIAPDRLLLIESRHDAFVPAETIEELWRQWGQPEIWREPHGHISVLLSPSVMIRIVNWLAACAKASSRLGTRET